MAVWLLIEAAKAVKSLPYITSFKSNEFSPASILKEIKASEPVFGRLIAMDLASWKRLEDFPLFRSIPKLSIISSTKLNIEKSPSDPSIF